MGQLATTQVPPAIHADVFGTANAALDTLDHVRLIPGSLRSATGRERKKQHSVLTGGVWGTPADQSAQSAHSPAAWLLPQGLRAFAPAMLGTAIVDFICLALTFSAESQLRPHWLSPSALCFYAAVFLLLTTHEGGYVHTRKDQGEQRFILVKTVGWTTLFALLAFTCSSPWANPAPLVLWSTANVCALCAWRWLWQFLRHGRHAGTARNVLVVGGSFSQNVIDALALDGKDTAIEFFPDHRLRESYGPMMLQRLARQHCADEVIIATEDSELAHAAIRYARRCQLDVLIAPNLFGASMCRLENRGGMPLVKVHEQPEPEWGLALKRVVDVLCALGGLLMLLPVFLVVAAAIKLDSPGPVFYRAIRIGRGGRRFRCYKFRTMVVGADSAKPGLRVHNQRDGAFFKIVNDPRMTRVGPFLRRYSLDELPQLWNVLLGEMSLVGPRPHPPDDVERYSVSDLRRLDVTPGMTGLWQVTARRDPSFERCMALDVDYIRRWSVMLDLRILWKTVAAVLQGSGA